jgi:hypothetical protein
MIGRTLGHYEIYVRPFSNAAGKWQISTGLQPIWARSGREIFYRNGDRMMAVSIKYRAGVPRGKTSAPLRGTVSRI